VYGFDAYDSLTEHVPTAAGVVASLSAMSPLTAWENRVQYVSVSEAWPFPDDHFDLVISNQVIEHVADLDLFLAQLSRTLKPGASSIHVFPLRRVLFEWHLKMPIVHLIEDHRLRTKAIELFTRARIGTYPEFQDGDGIDAATYAHTRADFIQFGTFYRRWPEIAHAAKSARLRAAHRYTRGLYEQKARAILSRDFVYRYPLQRGVLGESLAFALLPYLATATVVLQKPRVVDTWRAPHSESCGSSP